MTTFCTPRYAGLEIRRPLLSEVFYDTTIPVVGELILGPGRSRSDPAQIQYTVTAADASVTIGTIPLVDAGLYAGSATVADSPVHYLLLSWPEAGITSATDRLFFTDFSPPVIDVKVEPPPLRRVSAGFSELDPRVANLIDGGSTTPFFRRDEFARVVITGSAGITPSSVLLEAEVDLADGGVSFARVPLRSVACGAGQCPASGYCECDDADLSTVPLSKENDAYWLWVSGKRPASTVTKKRTGAIGITRWKWRYQLHPPSDAGYGYAMPPAIDSKGNVIVRTNGFECTGAGVCSSMALLSAYAGGTLRAISPGGDLVWQSAVPPVPSLGFAPAVGGGRVFLPHVPTFVFDTADGGSQAVSCVRPDDGGSPGFATSPLILTPTNGAYLHTAVSTADGGRTDALWSVRSSNLQCSATLTTQLNTPRGLFAGFAGSGTSLALDVHGTTVSGTNLGVVFYDNPSSTSFIEGANTVTTGLPEATTLTQTNASSIYLGLSGTVYQGSAIPDSGVLFRANGSGPITWRYPTSGSLGAGVGLVVLSDGSSYVLFNDGSSATFASVSSTGAGTTQSLHFGYITPPLLGKGGLVYLVGAGEISVVPTDGGASSRYWIWDNQPGFITSPNIDCTRGDGGLPIPGRPGVLYAISSGLNLGAFRNAELYAIIVDSPGIETNARWPKALHDPRNTNNAATDLSEFSCP